MELSRLTGLPQVFCVSLLFAMNVVCRCVHCVKLAPIWQQLAESFSGAEDVIVAEVDCSQRSSLCREQGVSKS